MTLFNGHDLAKIEAYLKPDVPRKFNEVKNIIRPLISRVCKKEKIPEEIALNEIIEIGANIISKKAQTWNKVKNVLFLIFDIHQVVIDPLVKKNKRMKVALRLKIETLKLPKDLVIDTADLRSDEFNEANAFKEWVHFVLKIDIQQKVPVYEESKGFFRRKKRKIVGTQTIYKIPSKA